MWNPTPMRRRDRALAEPETMALLQKCEYGFLATASAEGWPLATPLSYVLLDGAIYFHCAQKGQKLQNIAAQPRVCFTVVGETQPVYGNNNFSTYYESAVAHGAATAVQDADEKRRVLMALAEKYLPEHMDKAPGDIERSFDATCVVRIDLDVVTGKGKKPGQPV